MIMYVNAKDGFPLQATSVLVMIAKSHSLLSWIVYLHTYVDLYAFYLIQ